MLTAKALMQTTHPLTLIKWPTPFFYFYISFYSFEVTEPERSFP